MDAVSKIINGTMKSLIESNECLSVHGGFTYCAYGSKLLNEALFAKNINTKIMIGMVFSNNDDSMLAQENLVKIINNIPNNDPNGSFAKIKESFIKRKRLQSNTGHAVVQYCDKIFDITSGQFGLPSNYSFSHFKDMWKKVYEAEVIVTDKDNLTINKIKDFIAVESRNLKLSW